MSAELLIANLLRVAKEDLDGARLLGDSGNRNAIYLCEQAAGEGDHRRAYVRGPHANIKHQLDVMGGSIPDENPLKQALKAIAPLGACATTYRYPTSSGPA